MNTEIIISPTLFSRTDFKLGALLQLQLQCWVGILSDWLWFLWD